MALQDKDGRAAEGIGTAKGTASLATCWSSTLEPARHDDTGVARENP